MKVFAIGDLHLSLCEPFLREQKEVQTYKPMDIFGSSWDGYLQKLYDNWIAIVGRGDAVLIPGDISWGMTLDDCLYDWDFLADLPGKKYICKGNHDYWWQGISKVRESLPANVIPLNHDACVVGGKALCATRGWLVPGSSEWKEKNDRKIYEREILRLEMALKAGAALGLPQVMMLHYMPCNKKGEQNRMTELLQEYGVELCIYGHLHGEECSRAINDNRFGFDLLNVSADALDFCPRLLWQTD